MILRAILTILLLSPFKTAFSTKTIDTTKINTVYAEEKEDLEKEEQEESLPYITHILVNNEPKELLQDNKVLVTYDDAVRVSGISEPNSSFSIFVDELELKAEASEHGYWFVLFSVTNMEENQYVIRAGDTLKESKEILTLVVGDGEYLIDPLVEEDGIMKIITESKTSYIIVVLISIIAFALGLVLGRYIKKSKNKNK